MHEPMMSRPHMPAIRLSGTAAVLIPTGMVENSGRGGQS